MCSTQIIWFIKLALWENKEQKLSASIMILRQRVNDEESMKKKKLLQSIKMNNTLLSEKYI